MSEFVKRIRFLAAGQDDPQSIALSNCADRIEKLQEQNKIYFHAFNKAADRIEELEARVELLEGYLRGVLEIVERFVACDTKDARAALEGKDD